MTQTLYAHMNKRNKKRNHNILERGRERISITSLVIEIEAMC
jgi:hypothetical protein